MSLPGSSQFSGRLSFAWKIIQVRLRFFAAILAAFALMASWPWLQDAFRTTVQSFGSHSHSDRKVSDDTEFFCPMDPGVLSSWPAICPICKMDLVRRKRNEPTLLPEGTLARMQFSPYRIQLAGIQTSLAERRELFQTLELGGRVIDVVVDRGADGKSHSSQAHIQVPVEMRDASRLEVGLIAEVLVDPETTRRDGVLIEKRAQAEGETTVLRIEVDFGNAENQIETGRFAKVQFAMPYMAPSSDVAQSQSALPVAVPETAIVELGSVQVVYVESMPGMFDAINVSLGPRCGSWRPVLNGIEPGTRVATTGVFLIDAEARLNPAVGTAYFGASHGQKSQTPSHQTPSFTPQRTKTPKLKTGPLTPIQLAQAREQKTCPVTNADLDSMGGPVPIEVRGRTVFICCQGCEDAIRNDPDKYLAKTPAEK